MYQIITQYVADKALAPSTTLLRKWAKKALEQKITAAEITIRIVSIDEMSELNATYRKKQGPTNVLSFPFDLPEEVDMEIPILGDIVVCAEVVNKEAREQNKAPNAHWAHMIVHGVFHLLGYDHETDQEADVMEALEIGVMDALGFANPYEIGENIKHYD